MAQVMLNPDGHVITDPHYEKLLQSCFDLMSEVNCRLDHGAGTQPAQDHLRFVELKLQSMCYPTN